MEVYLKLLQCFNLGKNVDIMCEITFLVFRLFNYHVFLQNSIFNGTLELLLGLVFTA